MGYRWRRRCYLRITCKLNGDSLLAGCLEGIIFSWLTGTVLVRWGDILLMETPNYWKAEGLAWIYGINR